MRQSLMIVDDSPVMRSFVKRSIEIAGFPVARWVEAANGAEALRRLGEAPVDLVLTDINMPVMDGEALMRAMSLEPSFKTIPVVVVSTDSTHHRVNSLLALGARGFVRKPFAPERLLRLLSEIFPEWPASPEPPATPDKAQLEGVWDEDF